jgi:hypothetical protein
MFDVYVLRSEAMTGFKVAVADASYVSSWKQPLKRDPNRGT